MTDDLLAAVAELVAIPSESFAEAAFADYVEARLRSHTHLTVSRIGDNVVARTSHGNGLRVILAGHLDTVPANGNAEPRLEGDTLWGVGSADMKGGLAIMLRLAAELDEPANDLTFIFYAREEVASVHSGLLEIERVAPDLLKGDIAILGEPTNNAVEAGCQGVLRGQLTIRGARAHTARAWMGVNAIHRAAEVLDRLSKWSARTPVVEGCAFHEALLATAIGGGVAGNVVPDEVTIDIAHRFAPDRSLAEAEAWFTDWVNPSMRDADSWAITERAAGAYPGVTHPALAFLRDECGLAVNAKLGWTDVAFFASRGIPAVNLGPGDPVVAHTAGEHVERHSVELIYDVVHRLVTSRFAVS